MTTNSKAFFVAGEPKGQPRPRAFSRGGHARVYDPGTAEGWKSQIAIAAKEYLPTKPIAGPVYLSIRFYMKRPKSHFFTGKRAGILRDNARLPFVAKPDIDNLCKAVMDALKTLGMFSDDAKVWSLSALKMYATGPQATGANIEISY